MGEVGTGVVGTGVVGTGVVGTGVVGTGVVGTGVVGTGVVGTGVVGAGVVGAGDPDRCGRPDPDTCGVAVARATSALPPLAPAPCTAATGLCRGCRLGVGLWLDAGGATDGGFAATGLGIVASVQPMNPTDATPVSTRAPRTGRLALGRAAPRRRGRWPRGPGRGRGGGGG
jgi:hypothetical protein